MKFLNNQHKENRVRRIMTIETAYDILMKPRVYSLKIAFMININYESER